MASAAVAEAVVRAGGSTLVAHGGHRRGSRERVPPERPGGAGHHVGEAGAVQRRHRVGARARAFEDVAAAVDRALDVAGLARDANLHFHLVVVRLQLLEAERPVLDRGAGRQARRAIAPSRLARHLEVPGVQAPALGPVVQGGAADGVHHRVKRQPRRVRRRRRRTMRGNLAIRLLDRVRPAAEVVAQLVGRVVRRRQPGTRLEPDDVDARLRERQRGHAARRAEADDDDAGPGELSRHGCRAPRPRSARAGLRRENIE